MPQHRTTQHTSTQRGNRELVAAVFAGLGFTSVLECAPKRRVLIVLNYHRIGNACDTPYDQGVFSATPDEFEWQIDYLKRHFRITTLEEAVAMVNGDIPLQTGVLITFDDGYLDNFTLAFPILRAYGVQAAFFLPTSFIETNHVPWWDAIAYIIKHSRREVIRLQYPKAVEFDLNQKGIGETIKEVLQVYKQPTMTDCGRFLADLQVACDTSSPSTDTERTFMNWQEVREMLEGGMAFGSHTHTHEILSKLPLERQHEEVLRSRELLERELSRRIDTLAYPVGARHAFTSQTTQALKEHGYRAAFSFYGGFNLPGDIQPFDIHRFGVEPLSQARFRLRAALGALTGTLWF